MVSRGQQEHGKMYASQQKNRAAQNRLMLEKNIEIMRKWFIVNIGCNIH